MKKMSTSPHLKRELSLALLVFYGIGTILGAGIYVLVGKVAGAAGMFTPLSFLLAAALATFSAFSYAELSSRFPQSAGEAIYIEEGFHFRYLSILVGILISIVGIVSVATLAHGFAGYLSAYTTLSDQTVIMTLILLTGLVTAWGIGPSVWLASIMTVIEITGLLIIIYAGRDAFPLMIENFSTLIPPASTMVWSGILMGSFIAFYAYLGFEDIVNVAEEAVKPRINLPRAIIISLVVTTLFYILVAIVAIMLVPLPQLAASKAPLAMLYETHTGQSPVVISLISLVSVLNGALVQVIMASRVLYGMGKRQWLPTMMAYVHPYTRTPVIAIAVVTLLILVFALLLPLLSLAKLTSFITLTIFSLINFALLKIKISTREHAGFTVPVMVPLLGGISSLGFIIYMMISM